ncbi:fungal transcriptional regulatory protein [Purpureocillium lavendulum]|uniref:Vacuolar-sorting protein SNF7 n=1 Tax=Purpureocillium lavendulum TaxID=1247861 RepID=A0AB34FLS3_9HYPO|nr:fungal transcriptional regulatory protein [Purpureocillium lavendulum]
MCHDKDPRAATSSYISSHRLEKDVSDAPEGQVKMWSWFGGAAAQRAKDSPKDAILGLRSHLDMLQKREKHLQNQIDEQQNIARKNANTNKNAAKAALRRKKTHEQALDQTIAQIGTLEQQINSIESANINRETLAAMEKASQAMKQIHGKLTPEKVDETMYDVPTPPACHMPHEASICRMLTLVFHREKLREQNALSQEIVDSMIQTNIGEPVDDTELEEELEQMQQEQLDEAILKTGNVPVADAVHKMPTPANTEPVASRRQEVEEDDEEAELRKLQAEMAM